MSTAGTPKHRDSPPVSSNSSSSPNQEFYNIFPRQNATDALPGTESSRCQPPPTDAGCLVAWWPKLAALPRSTVRFQSLQSWIDPSGVVATAWRNCKSIHTWRAELKRARTICTARTALTRACMQDSFPVHSCPPSHSVSQRQVHVACCYRSPMQNMQ